MRTITFALILIALVTWGVGIALFVFAAYLNIETFWKYGGIFILTGTACAGLLWILTQIPSSSRGAEGK
jgi:hypothetical protein